MLRAGGWLEISLPAIAVKEERFVLSNPPPRTHLRRIGDLLDPIREPREVLDQLKRQMGNGAFQAQYQQAPMPPNGEAIKLSWFRRYDELPEDGETVFSVDTASKAGLRNDWSVIAVWRIAGGRCYLEYLWRRVK